MLLREENELLTRTGPGTPMGETMRRYWIPALLSREIPEPDCAPVRVKLLGERLVMFRDSEGRIGLLDEFCAHRGTSLRLGRSEQCGLRCVWHGWKYDVTGQCVHQLNETEETSFAQKIRIKSYPTCELGGVVWHTWDRRRKFRLGRDSVGRRRPKLTATSRRSSKNVTGCKGSKAAWINLMSAFCARHFATIRRIPDRYRILSMRAAVHPPSTSSQRRSVTATSPSDRSENGNFTCAATTSSCRLPRFVPLVRRTKRRPGKNLIRAICGAGRR